MKFQTWHVRCDHPECDRTESIPSSTDVPEGWRKVDSTAHIPPTPRTTPRHRVNWSSRTGRFSLHLCPGHGGFFDAHLPQTHGYPGRRGKDPTVTVSCSCGASLGWTRAETGSREGEPSYMPERVWWRHLPAELRAYFAQLDRTESVKEATR